MSQTKVHLPALAPDEYRVLMQALQFFHGNEKSVATDKHTDFTIKNQARVNALAAQDLITKLG